MKKILYLITQSDFGGAQVYIYNLATNLHNDYEIIVAGGEQGYDGELAKKLKKENIKYIFLPNLFRAINPIKDFLALFEIVELIKKEKPDIIHLNSSKISILGSMAIFFSKLQITNYKLQTIYTVHGWVFNEPMPRIKKLFYKYAEKFTSIFKDEIICVSEYDKQVAIKNSICKPERLTTIHNGIKKLSFLEKQEAKKKLDNLIPSPVLGADQGEIIGTIANLYKTKGLKYLIKSMSQLLVLSKTEGLKVNCKLVIFGEGLERKALEKLIKKYKLENNVYLLGDVKKASQYLKAFDIYVCSSVKEGFPYSILEAMQASLPIISTDVGGIPEMITNNESGLLIDSKNPEALAESIKKLIENPGLKEKLSNNAKEKVLKEFNLDNFNNKTNAIYKKED